MSRSATSQRRTAAVVTERQAERAERQAVRALQADLQTIIDAISAATTLAELRGHVKDTARVVRRVVRLDSVSG